MLTVGDGQQGAEGGPVAGGGVLVEVFLLVLDELGCEEVLTEAFAEFEGDVAHGAVAIDVLVEVVVGECPVLVVLLDLTAVPGEEVHFGRAPVDETELVVEDGYLARGADSFGYPDLLRVLFPVLEGTGIGLEVDAQVLPSRELEGLGIPHRRVEVQIQGNLPAWQCPLSEFDFCCWHDLKLFEEFVQFIFLVPDLSAFCSDLSHAGGFRLVEEAFHADVVALGYFAAPYVVATDLFGDVGLLVLEEFV